MTRLEEIKQAFDQRGYLCNDESEFLLTFLIEMVKILIGYIPDGWEMPLRYNQIVAQVKELLEEMK